MTALPLSKLHATGNDFLVHAALTAAERPLVPASVAALCDRHRGVGADGLLRRTVAPFDLHYFARREIELLVESCGYAVENVYGSHDLEPYWAGSPKLLVVAAARGAARPA